LASGRNHVKLREALSIINARSADIGPVSDIYLATGFTPLHLATFLHAELLRRQPSRVSRVRIGRFGMLLESLQEMGELRPDAGVAVVEWGDLNGRFDARRSAGWSRAGIADACAESVAYLDTLVNICEKVAGSVPLAIALPVLPLDPVSHYPVGQMDPLVASLHAEVAQTEARLARVRGVRVIDRMALLPMVPLGARQDIGQYLATGFPYRTDVASSLADALASLVVPASPKKGLVTDLDGTLWKGIVGDDGPGNVHWDLDHGAHIHTLYQRTLGALADAGVLIGVASKNDPEIAQKALDREDLVVPAHTLFPREIHWESKADSIQRILRTWNIGADAVVFVDDNPLELEIVARRFPEVEGILFPGVAEAFPEFLKRLRNVFAKEHVIEEDRLRAESIRYRSHVAASDSGTADVQETLIQELEGEVTITTIEADDIRALELINKTNQFNLNGRRVTGRELRELLTRPGAVGYAVSYRDKFGPLGKIAILLGVLTDRQCQINTWVMSCRAFGRRIEHATLTAVLETMPADELHFDYEATPRNGPLADLIMSLLGRAVSGPFTVSREEVVSRMPPQYAKRTIRGIDGISG
jgi:FkbH-like protein